MFGFFRRTPQPVNGSAAAAKDRLQILLAHERSDRSRAEFLPLLKRDILEVVRRHVKVERDQVAVNVQQEDDISTLEINIELPDGEMIPARGAA